MPNLTKEERAGLVGALSFNAGQAEMGDPRIVFPVPEHLRAIEAEVVLIVGDRGSGKTQLVRALEQADIRNALARYAPGLRTPAGEIEWRTVFPWGTLGPDSMALRNFVRSAGGSPDDLLTAWYAYLVRALQNRLSPGAQKALAPLFQVAGVDVASCVNALRAQSLVATAAIDALDQDLEHSGRWLFIAYDELDTAVSNDWGALGAVVRGVVSLWASYARRWRRIRPKIFLRSDFYKHHREIAGADVSKLAANRVELQWSDKNLYGALIKHTLNKRVDGDEALREHLARSVTTGLRS